MVWYNTSESKQAETQSEKALSPLVGFLLFTGIAVTASTVPAYLILRRRLTRMDGTLTDVLHAARSSAARNAQSAEGALREVRRVGTQIEELRALVERGAGDMRDVRSLMMKERVRGAGVVAQIGALSAQLQTHEKRVIAGLAAEQRRGSKTESEINELRKTADQNAGNLSKLAISLADVAGFIERTEIEEGVLPEDGQESSKRVTALRSSALGVLESVKQTTGSTNSITSTSGRS